MRHLIIEYELDCIGDNNFLEQAELFDCDIEQATSCQQVIDLVAKSNVHPVVVIGDNYNHPEVYYMISELRKMNSAYVVILCAENDPNERARLLSIGANYVIVEPFNYQELLHVVVFLFEVRSPYLSVDKNIELDYKNWVIGYKGQNINVTAKVFKTLDFLMDNKDCVKSRAEICQYVSGYALKCNERIVDTYIKRIRAATEYDLIVTVRNEGYMYIGLPSSEQTKDIEA